MRYTRTHEQRSGAARRGRAPPPHPRTRAAHGGLNKAVTSGLDALLAAFASRPGGDAAERIAARLPTDGYAAMDRAAREHWIGAELDGTARKGAPPSAETETRPRRDPPARRALPLPPRHREVVLTDTSGFGRLDEGARAS